MKKQSSKWLVFLLMAVTQFMVVLDSVIVNVALPTIKQALHFNQSALQWVVTAYALTFGGFLLLGGRAADLFGRRRVLLTGMVGFTLISLLIGLAPNPATMITLRALQGLTAALMSPAALSLVLTTFKEGDERNRALSLWTVVATGGAALGMLLGGVLTQYLDWRWNFFVNVPIGILVSLGVLKYIPAHAKEERSHKELDLPGAAMITGGLMAFVYAVSNAPAWGWLSAPTLGIFLLAVLLTIGFIVNEKRSQHPLMPLSIFKVRNVTGANLMMAPLFATVMGMFFLTVLYMSSILGYSPMQVGLSFLPFPVVISLMSTRMPRLVGRFGYKRFLVAGPLLAAAGLLWLLRLPVHGAYFPDILPTILLMPLGMGLTFMPLMAAATSGVPAREAGLASGLINTSQQMGGALGLAILTGVATSATAAAKYLDPAAALVHGFHRAFLVGVAFALVVSILAMTIIKQPRRSKQNASVSGRAVEAGLH